MINYHVSKFDLGSKVKLTASVPDSRAPTECNKTLRVCFCPSIFQCLIAVAGSDNIKGVLLEFLYVIQRTKHNPVIYTTRKNLVKPDTVSDFKTTGELWSLKDIEVTKKGYLCIDSLVKGVIEITEEKEFSITPDYTNGFIQALRVGWKL